MIRLHGNRANCLRARYCRKQASWLWGQKRIITPELVPWRFGNGRLVIAIRPIATRRSHYVVAVDDRWDLNADGGLREHLAEIYGAIEDWFGHCWCEACLDDPDKGEQAAMSPHSCWPAPCFNTGTEWWELGR